jgi:hypothetical protein
MLGWCRDEGFGFAVPRAIHRCASARVQDGFIPALSICEANGFTGSARAAIWPA